MVSNDEDLVYFMKKDTAMLALALCAGTIYTAADPQERNVDQTVVSRAGTYRRAG
jgi:hypothetical protein